MTEQAQKESVPPTEPAPEPAPPPVEIVAEKTPFLRKINPLNLFKKESPAGFVREGEDLLDDQNAAQATMAFQRALAMDPNCVPAFKGLGNVFLKKGGRSNLNTALEHFQDAAKRNPFDVHLFAVKAKIFEKLGKMKEATLERKKMMIVKTLESDPKNTIANNNMGILLSQQNQVQSAIEYFKKALHSNPRYDVAYRNLAATNLKIAAQEQDEEKKRELLSQARSFINKALEIASTVPSLMMQAKIFMQGGRHEEALAASEKAEVMEGANKEVFGMKRLALEKLNRIQEAQQAYEIYKVLSLSDAKPTKY